MRGTNLLLALSVSLVVPAFAGPESASRDYLIQKLNHVYMSLAPGDSSKVAVTLRLADLMAERARVNSMDELSSGCTNCNAGLADRKKALQLYKEVFEKTPMAQRAKVMIQMGHLEQVLGNERTAIEFYTKLSTDGSDPVAQAEANLSLAEIYFKKSQWNLAISYYEKVIAAPQASSKGLSAYRRAWSLFNQGQVAVAQKEIEEILKSPALLSKTGSSTNQIDPGFQEEVARDYATFLGRNLENPDDIKKLFELSPEKSKIPNATVLAVELERTGKKEQALKAWEFVHQKQSEPQLRLETLAHMGSLNLDLGRKEKTKEIYNQIFDIVPQLKANFPKQVEEARKTIRQSVVIWNQAEKKAPTIELLETYQAYIKAFGFEKEMNAWAVQTASDLKMWDKAWAIHNKNPMDKMSNDEMENHLLLGIEIAESSKAPELINTAQEEYLSKSTKNTKTIQVKYQKAYKLYETEKYDEARQMLKVIALNSAAPMDLRIKAGDLIFDSLAAQKKDTEIEKMAEELGGQIKDIKNHSNWVGLGQKSVLNQVAQLSNQPDLAWAKLAQFNPSKAEPADVLVYQRNKLALAEKRMDINGGINAANDLLNLKGASADDQTLAQAKLAYFHDLKMDFRSAMKATETLPEKILSADKKTLKLALYADLTGQSSAPYLQKFLEMAKTDEEKIAASLEIVKKSKDFEPAIAKQKAILMKNPELLASLLLENYNNTKAPWILKMFEKETALNETSSGKIIARDELLAKIKTQATKLAAHQIDSKNQKTVAKTLKERVNYLNEFDKIVNQAIKSTDWSAQVLSLSVVAKESKRIYDQILSLPMPENLNENEQSEYMNILGQQASPFNNKAELAQAKVNEFWGGSTWKPALEKSMDNVTAGNLIKNELAALLTVAPAAEASFIGNLKPTVQAIAVKPSLETIELAKNELKANPFSPIAIEKLKKLEMQLGNKPMVQYLESRAQALTGMDQKKGTN